VYTVRNWNEEVMKWLAVAMCLAMMGMAVMPAVGVGDASYVLYKAGYVSTAGWEAAQTTAASWGLIGSGVAVFNPAVGGSILIGAGVGLF
jgi:hypothetical protein